MLSILQVDLLYPYARMTEVSMLNYLLKLPYRGTLEKFYQYMDLGNSNVNLAIRWKPEVYLQRNIELYKSRHEKFIFLSNQKDNIRELVQFWIDMAVYDLPPQENWEPNNRVQKAWEHLAVYCEESCYYAALNVWKAENSQSWEELIFLARCLIYDRDKFKNVLVQYNNVNSLLDTYITKILINTVKDKTSIGKFSTWRLFIHKSDKELKEALFRDGRSELEISKFLFARKYFKQVYQMNQLQNPAVKKGKKYPEPSETDLMEVVNYYNTEKLLSGAPHEVAAGGNITVEQLKVWIQVCIAALYNYPKSIASSFSLEALQDDGREFESPYQEVFEVGLSSSTKDTSLVNKAEAALMQQLYSLKLNQQKILLLYYGFELNQTQIANNFKLTQGAIAARLKTIELKLIKSLSQLSQPSEWVAQYVTGWLVTSYQSPVYSDLINIALVEAVNKLEQLEKEALRLCYGQKMHQKDIAHQLQITELDLALITDNAKAQLEHYLIKEIDCIIIQYLNVWLSNTCKQIIKSACNNLKISSQTYLEALQPVLEESLKVWQLPSK
ncbi:hypothetical protein NIES4071_19740 [Calothrix sp. NIES-4071]|nr:hypothetical protein NIES4071_19740 [Calothrix sp. NIES-4071]BAZ56307.1 hypothetical protein NIES4105_19690 [Calothrix sp. NIES-4105]